MDTAAGPLRIAAQISFYMVAAGTLAGAWAAVSARNLFRAALGLAMALFGVAAIYLYLEAEFLAVAQLLVYVGAILTLIIFGVMLTARIADPSVPRWNKQVVAAAVVSLLIGAGLAAAFLKTPFEMTAPASAPAGMLKSLGNLLLSYYLLPFELLSLLLLGALVGSIFIARKEKE